jgi:hypothetical protein
MSRRNTAPPALAFAAFLACSATGCHEPTSPGNAARASTITAADIQGWVTRLADDSTRGRDTPSPELDEAATVIAAYFARLGLVPAFPESSYIARYPTPPGGSGPDSAPNVGGILLGSDPALVSEYVVLIAHLDHLGVGPPAGTDSVYNGADDNASGTAGVLELAEAFVGTNPRPRRSLIFLLVTGEEDGYWGSQWYVDHPPVPLGSIVGVLTLDMISRNGADSIQVGGLDLSTMGLRVSEVLHGHPELGFRTVLPGPQGGSDFVPFWTHGIPWVFLFTGLHPDYHTPRDEPDRIDADKAARVTRLAFHTTLLVANTSARPQWLSSLAPPAGAGTPPL